VHRKQGNLGNCLSDWGWGNLEKKEKREKKDKKKKNNLAPPDFGGTKQ